MQPEIDEDGSSPLKRIINKTLTQATLSSLANFLNLELERNEDGTLDAAAFMEALSERDHLNARKKASAVASFINNLGEEVPQQEQDVLEWKIIFSSFTSLVDALKENPEDVEIIFSEEIPLLDCYIALWRMAGFLSHMAWRYKDSIEAKNDPVKWLRSKKIEAVWNLEDNIGIPELHAQFMKGDFDF